MTELRIWDWGKARPHTFAELEPPEDIDQPGLAALAVNTLFTLGDGLFEPLAVEAIIANLHEEYDIEWEPAPAAPFHQLRHASVPAWVRVDESYNDTQVAQCEPLDHTSVLDWLRTILEQEPPRPGVQPGFTRLDLKGVRARLPKALHRQVARGVLRVGQRGGTYAAPVERFDGGLWVAGPDEWDSPFDVTISHDGGLLDLAFTQNWSPWIDADGAGRGDVEAAIGRLWTLGWRPRG